MPILNFSTKIDADKTASEISRCLSNHGAHSILTDYNEEEGYVEALSFQIRIGEQVVAFRLPSDWRPVLTILENDRKVPRRMATREQAVRVAWRIIKDWVEAQMALVETKMATTQEVFLPYAIMPDGKTLAERITKDPKFLLGAGKKE